MSKSSALTASCFHPAATLSRQQIYLFLRSCIQPLLELFFYVLKVKELFSLFSWGLKHHHYRPLGPRNQRGGICHLIPDIPHHSPISLIPFQGSLSESILHQEMQSLLILWAIELVAEEYKRRSFYSHYFVTLQKRGMVPYSGLERAEHLHSDSSSGWLPWPL